MEAMAQSHVRNADSTTRQLEEISGSIQKLGAQVTAFIDAGDQSESITKLVDDLGNILQNLALAPTQTPADIRILNRLYFNTMFERQQKIDEASHGTFQWLLDEEPPTLSREYMEEIFGQDFVKQRVKNTRAYIPSVRDDIHNRVEVHAKFQHWLNAGGAFHVSGKAGSGKSTLMRCLIEDPRLKARLENWAIGKKLVVSSFFFSRLGDDDQQSLTGFYRSLLFSVLEKCSDLIKDVFPTAFAMPERPGAHWQDNPFTALELRRALDLLIGDDATISHFGDYRFCFFIDGLDEYDGDSSEHSELAEQLNRWAASPFIRICVSSRPKPEFLDVFPEKDRICLHQATGLDILRLIHGELRKAKLLEHLMGAPLVSAGRQDALTSSDLLARELSIRANGVFLWVRLAIKSIHIGKRYRYSIQHILGNICKMPHDLDRLFEQMLQAVRSEDRQLSARLLLLLTSERFDLHRRQCTLLMLSYIHDLDDDNFPFSLPTADISDEEYTERIETGHFLLQSLTMGLFESEKSIPKFGKTKLLLWPQPNEVSAFHSTVLEYLRCPARKQFLHDAAGTFDIHDAFIRLFLATVVVTPTFRNGTTLSWAEWSLQTFFDPGSDERGQLSLAAFDKVYGLCAVRKYALSGRSRSGFIGSVTTIHYHSQNVPHEATIDHDWEHSSRVITQSNHRLLYIAAAQGQVDIVAAKVQADKTLLFRAGGRLNLLYLACRYGNVRLVAALLALGATPNDEMFVIDRTITPMTPMTSYGRDVKVTVWSVFLRTGFACFPDAKFTSLVERHICWVDLKFWDILGLMLQRNPDLGIIFRCTTKASPETSSRSVALSLETVLKILKPPDLDRFLAQIKEIRKHGDGQSKEATVEKGLDAFGPDDFQSLDWFVELQVGDRVLSDLEVFEW